jgi:hypothetical protein
MKRWVLPSQARNSEAAKSRQSLRPAGGSSRSKASSGSASSTTALCSASSRRWSIGGSPVPSSRQITDGIASPGTAGSSNSAVWMASASLRAESDAGWKTRWTRNGGLVGTGR